MSCITRLKSSCFNIKVAVLKVIITAKKKITYFNWSNFAGFCIDFKRSLYSESAQTSLLPTAI